jgi:cyanophycin synthetase
VKSIVVRNARHWAILNADDSLCLAMKETTKAEHLCLVSERPRSEVIRRHLAKGGTAVMRSDRSPDAFLRLRRGKDILGQIAASAIPATFGGRFNPPVWNAMFAMAAAHAHGLPFETIEAALSGFHSDHEANPGRMNWIHGLPFALLLTFADGPVALAELASLIRGKSFPAGKTLVFYAVGNRPDSFIVDSASAVAGSFDRYVCCEMEEDRRGRQVGEVAGLLAVGLRDSGVSETAIQIEPSDSAALASALEGTAPDALLVVVNYHYPKVMACIRNLWPLAR